MMVHFIALALTVSLRLLSFEANMDMLAEALLLSESELTDSLQTGFLHNFNSDAHLEHDKEDLSCQQIRPRKRPASPCTPITTPEKSARLTDSPHKQIENSDLESLLSSLLQEEYAEDPTDPLASLFTFDLSPLLCTSALHEIDPLTFLNLQDPLPTDHVLAQTLPCTTGFSTNGPSSTTSLSLQDTAQHKPQALILPSHEQGGGVCTPISTSQHCSPPLLTPCLSVHSPPESTVAFAHPPSSPMYEHAAIEEALQALPAHPSAPFLADVNQLSLLVHHLFLHDSDPYIPLLPKLLGVFLAIQEAPHQALLIVRAFCEEDSHESLSSTLRDLHKEHPQESARLRVIAEFYAFLLSTPSLDLTLLNQVVERHPHSTEDSQEQPRFLELFQSKVKLTYALQNIQNNLIQPANNLHEILETLKIHRLSFENTLLNAYSFLRGEKRSNKIKRQIAVSYAAHHLCRPSHDVTFKSALTCIRNAESGVAPKVQIFLKKKKSNHVTYQEILEVYEVITKDFSQARAAIADLYIKELFESPPEKCKISFMLSQIVKSFTPLAEHYTASMALQSITDCTAFLLSQPPLDLGWLAQVRSAYPNQKRFTKTTIAKGNQVSSNLRMQTRLTYILQTLKERCQLPDIASTIEHCQIKDLDLGGAFNKSCDTLGPNPSDYPGSNTAHELCVQEFSCKKSLAVLKLIELESHSTTESICCDPLSGYKFAEPSHSTDDIDQKAHLTPAGLDQENASTVHANFSTTPQTKKNSVTLLAINQLEAILKDPTQALSALQSIMNKISPTSPPLQSLSEAVKSITQALGSSTSDRSSLTVRTIGELCTFMLSSPTFDFKLFKEVQKQYPGPLSHRPTVDCAMMKVREWRMQMKITYSLQNLQQNLVHNADTLEDLLQLLDLDLAKADFALYQSNALCLFFTRHPHLKHPLKVSRACHLCAPGTPAQNIIDLLTKEESAYAKHNPTAYQALLNGPTTKESHCASQHDYTS